MRRTGLSSRWRRDDGQLLPLIIGYAVVLALLIVVVTDVSKVYLQRRALAAAADAAALVAVNMVDPAAVVDGRVGQVEALIVSEEAAAARVADYAIDAHLAERFEQFAVTNVVVDPGGTQVTVTLASTVSLPFVNDLAASAEGLAITATANAQAPLLPQSP